MLIGPGLEKSWWKRKMKVSKRLKAKIKRVVKVPKAIRKATVKRVFKVPKAIRKATVKRVFKVPKAIRKSKVIGKVLSLVAIAAAVVFVPGIGAAVLSGIKTAGAGLGSLSKLLAGGAKIIGKATIKTAAGIGKTFLVQKASGALVKVPITEAEDNEIEQEITKEILPAEEAGLSPEAIQALLSAGILPSEKISKAEVRSETIQNRKNQYNKAVPLLVGATSLILSLV